MRRSRPLFPAGRPPGSTGVHSIQLDGSTMSSESCLICPELPSLPSQSTVPVNGSLRRTDASIMHLPHQRTCGLSGIPFSPTLLPFASTHLGYLHLTCSPAKDRGRRTCHIFPPQCSTRHNGRTRQRDRSSQIISLYCLAVHPSTQRRPARPISSIPIHLSPTSDWACMHLMCYVLIMYRPMHIRACI